ncbi:Predicted GTP-binding protein MMR1 [Phaffia rhodozyma]|uniref:Predicted GTP-binding protein MMR1 n=1 Tax=Phaffia rhodozyma TaxID=264483 RepID=A0A0F7SID2_PHARH|nr:Predicted GTP-binding protein MMR1 [Phaffia rhodozyma]
MVDGNGLGRAIIKNKIKVASTAPDELLHFKEADDRLRSVTQEGDLDEFLNTAQLAATDFTAERQNVKIITAPTSSTNLNAVEENPHLLSVNEEAQVREVHGQMKNRLRVPRRPMWNKDMTARQLERSERDSFLEWRRGLAELSDLHSLLLTPFERNLEVWRQLWRVLERSHLIVQIVDARNPDSFRCGDLEEYVASLDVEGRPVGADSAEGSKRKSLLLINKSDLLTLNQRRQWADHFESLGIRYAFFSALNATALQEAAALAAQAAALAEEEASSDEDDSERDESSDEDEAELADKVSRPVGFTGPAYDGEEEKKAGIDLEHDEQRLEEGYEERLRVLSVLELEELFESEAPSLNDFVTADHPKPPSKLVVGLVGYPNVGKSSTINALLGSKRVSVSATPGKTKHFQTLPFTPEITLCDCPGLVFPQFATTKAELVCDGVLPIDQMREYSGPIELVARRVPREVLEMTYAIRIEVTPIEDGGTGKVKAEDFLSSYAIARGYTRASFGLPDTSRAARYVLKDYVNAKLLYCHPPPNTTADEFNEESRAKQMEAMALLNKKKAPVTRVGKGADTFVRETDGPNAGSLPDPAYDDQGNPIDVAPDQTKATPKVFSSISSRADNRPSLPMSQISRGIDRGFFKEDNVSLEARPRTKGTSSRIEGAEGFSRPRMYGVQNSVGNDGSEIDKSTLQTRFAELGTSERRENGKASKRHFKEKKGKKRSGAGYD